MSNDGGPAYPTDSYNLARWGMSFRDVAFLRQLDGRIDFTDPEDWADQCSLAWNAAQVATDTRQRRLDSEQAG